VSAALHAARRVYWLRGAEPQLNPRVLVGDDGATCSARIALGDHRHDWRVDPEQVIEIVGDLARVRVMCLICTHFAVVETPMTLVPVASDPQSWRPYQFKSDDRIFSLW
jgi:hypothetical protein